MATNTGKKARKATATPEYVTNFREVHPLNYAQETYLDAIINNDIIFGIGSAGTGKTYLAAGFAAKQLFYKKIDKIIITRPNVEAGPALGHLPGELDEKFLPYLDPFVGAFSKSLGPGFYEYCVRNKVIEPKPIGFMRGSTFENAIVLIDEAQNISKTEFKMILSRIGKNCKIILSGDPDQVDIKNSGLKDAVDRLEGIQGIEVVRFIDSDIVRSKLCKEVIIAYKD